MEGVVDHTHGRPRSLRVDVAHVDPAKEDQVKSAQDTTPEKIENTNSTTHKSVDAGL